MKGESPLKQWQTEKQHRAEWRNAESVLIIPDGRPPFSARYGGEERGSDAGPFVCKWKKRWRMGRREINGVRIIFEIPFAIKIFQRGERKKTKGEKIVREYMPVEREGETPGARKWK